MAKKVAAAGMEGADQNKVGKKTHNRKRKQHLSTYIYRSFKVLDKTGKHTMSQKSMAVLESIAQDIMSRVVVNANSFASSKGSKTISVKEIDSATKILLSTNMAKKALQNSKTAHTRYTQSFGGAKKKKSE